MSVDIYAIVHLQLSQWNILHQNKVFMILETLIPKNTAGMKCLRMEWSCSFSRSWGFRFHKSNISENPTSFVLEILINEYQIAFSPCGILEWNVLRDKTRLRLSCAIRSYQIQMCVRPEPNPQKRPVTVMISLDIQMYCFYIIMWLFLTVVKEQKAESSRFCTAAFQTINSWNVFAWCSSGMVTFPKWDLHIMKPSVKCIIPHSCSMLQHVATRDISASAVFSAFVFFNKLTLPQLSRSRGVTVACDPLCFCWVFSCGMGAHGPDETDTPGPQKGFSDPIKWRRDR